MRADAAVERLSADAYTIPTDAPEADGTAAWTSTTIVVVHAEAGGRRGLGYSYTDAGAARLIADKLAPTVVGCDAMDPPAGARALRAVVRNIGREGVAAAAISAVDIALWDLKARLLERPLAVVLGRYRDHVAIYGSGGFTSYDELTLARQLSGWVEQQGCRWVKMKVGSDPGRDPARVAAARAAIGSAGLFVDANGAYGVRQAQHYARVFAAESGVSWFEEPVSADDLRGLRRVREHAPDTLEVAAGEYGYTLDYFLRMLQAQAVDVQQADATRCGGVSGFLRAAVLCEAFHIDLSAHCAPALHCQLGCAAPRFRHVEWFHDHVRIEQLLFDGAPVAQAGMIRPDLSRPGLGLVLKQRDAARFAVPVGAS
jgi:L-alanine-DL-glutamate epimerase-like enolase superfamily enzyme